MASSPKFICLVFLLLTLFSTQIDGRESMFFNKVSANPTTTTTINNNNVNNANKEEDQQPSFLPETQSYGLYGQESSELPANKLGNARYTTSSYVPSYKSETNGYNTNYYNNNNNRYNNNNAYEEQPEKLGETSLQETGYYGTMSNQNNYYTGANGYSNTGKQGMSDTRYLENGKYFYDLDNEKNYYQNYQNQARNPEGYYRASGNGYQYNGNSGRYQNHNDFQESQDEQYVP
uniref:Protein E6-like n=1 Tax=Rhizophora mucronata TaxID=61149 RepID=A0A2P2IQJ6_RHIMU